MAWHNKNNYPVDKIRQWISQGKTQAWIGDKICVSPKLIYKVCKKNQIKCQRRGPRSGEGHPDWKGGYTIDKSGYKLIYAPWHPNARYGRYILEHRLVMEKHLGRLLLRTEVVHHKNGNKLDNRLENLELFQRNSDHLKHELTGKVPNWTEDGKAKILAGVRKSAANRQKKKQDVYLLL